MQIKQNGTISASRMDMRTNYIKMTNDYMLGEDSIFVKIMTMVILKCLFKS